MKGWRALTQLPTCRYLNSKSDAQLRGASASVASLHTSCDPEALLNGSSNAVIDPCGLVAWSYFNDTFLVSSLAAAPILVAKAHIPSLGMPSPCRAGQPLTTIGIA